MANRIFKPCRFKPASAVASATKSESNSSIRKHGFNRDNYMLKARKLVASRRFGLIMIFLSLGEIALADSDLEKAVNTGNLEKVAEVVKQADPADKAKALNLAIAVPGYTKGDFPAIVEALLNGGAQAEIRHVFLAIDRHGHNGHRTADNSRTLALLLTAMAQQKISVDTILPGHKGSISELDRMGLSESWLEVTALTFALLRYKQTAVNYPGNVTLTYVPMIQSMLEAGADPDAKDRKGNQLDEFIKPVSEEVIFMQNGERIRNEHTRNIERLLKLENETRGKLRELLKLYRIKKAQKQLEDLDK